MADNVTLPGTGELISTEEVTTLNGVVVAAQQVERIANVFLTAGGTAVDAFPDRAGTATETNKTGTGSNLLVLAANPNRLGVIIYNDAGVTSYIKFGSAASPTAFTVKMVDQAYWEMPLPVYTGAIYGYWASGDMRITELTT